MEIHTPAQFFDLSTVNRRLSNKKIWQNNLFLHSPTTLYFVHFFRLMSHKNIIFAVNQPIDAIHIQTTHYSKSIR